jgi:hypothetical protein
MHLGSQVKLDGNNLSREEYNDIITESTGINVIA